MRPDRVVLAVATPVGAALLYFLLAGEVSAGEAIAGAPVVVISCLYAVAIARTATAPMQLRMRAVWSLLRGFGNVIPDLWRVGRALLRAGEGAVIQVPFRFGALGAEDIGRRAAVVAAISLAPNGVALGMDHDVDALLVHQLVPNPVGSDREWPA